MSSKPSDQEIIATLAKKIGAAVPKVEYDAVGNLLKLSLSGLGLSQLPSEISQLITLQELYLSDNNLSKLPPEIGQLTQLRELFLSRNQLRDYPSEMNLLVQLRTLRLNTNQLNRLPSDIGLLTELQELDLSFNDLSDLPPEIGQLTQLQSLDVRYNRLNELPPEIGGLSNLQNLLLSRNRLGELPIEIGQLTNLKSLDLRSNPNLHVLPPEITSHRTVETLTFLRELQQENAVRYEGKLLVIGEGGTGKSSLLRLLQGDTFAAHLSTTHGVEVSRLELPHPDQPQVEITLNIWDFGGQQSYFATQQLFFTRSALYVIVWNSRLGVEQGRLDYWLETIKSIAPDAPILLVATHTDERPPDLDYQGYTLAYPQLIGNLSVSNRTRAGLTELRAVLAIQASRLPYMGQQWPKKWMAAEKALLDRSEHYIDAATYSKCCSSCGIDERITKNTLGTYLHELGKIIYFQDDYILSNLIILKPEWVASAIIMVINDEVTKRTNGVFQHSDLPRIWAIDDEGQMFEPHLYPVLLRLMERFDLSYQIESNVLSEHATCSLVPQLLPYQPPINLPPWPKIPPEGQTQVEMVYRFDFVPADIMSWFIVRTHRYTRNLHWREGVLLAYQGHEARVELNLMPGELRLLVWGVQPHNFFSILMNTVDIILSRFQGLVVRREIPCICHWDRTGAEPCTHFYSYEELIRRMEARRYKVECSQTFAEVSVPMLLYGMHSSTDEQVMTDIQSGQQRIEKRLDDLQKLDIILEKLHQQSELIVRNFTRHWNLEMQKVEAECPNTFLLALGRSNRFNPKNWVSQDYILHLVCQHPPGPHRVGDGYKLREAEEWWVKVSPWLNQVIKFIKFGVPMGKAIGAVYDGVDVEYMKAQIDLMDEISHQLPEISLLDTLNDAVIDPQLNYEQRVIGPALRAIYSFLSKADPGHIWGGLNKTLTPDGNILWLCEEHRKQYEVKPLSLEM